MSSPRSMQVFRASRFARAMALFAWLMLVVASLPATAAGSHLSSSRMPAGMASMAAGGMQKVQLPSVSHHGRDCCGDPAHADCHCEAMCGSLLMPAMALVSGSHAPSNRYAAFYGVEAPTPDAIPPLRPPAA